MTGDAGPPVRRLLALRTSGPEDTRELAAATAIALRPGDVISLTGELGAGKTCFVQGAARALGVRTRVTSPTFTLVRPYQGSIEGRTIDLAHVDVYRLDRLQDVVDLGDDVIGGPDRITFIEWGDTVAALLPDDRLDVEIVLGEREDERLVQVRGHGQWGRRLADLVPPLARWMDAAEGPGPEDGRA